MCTLYNLLFLFGTFFSLADSRHVQFFRKDYVYNTEFDAFYKLHWDLHGLSWSAAFMACSDEGAILFNPKDKEEWNIAKKLTQELTEQPNVTDIFVGLHDEFGLGQFMTVDGHSTSTPLETVSDSESKDETPGEVRCILMNINTGLYKLGSCVSDEPIPFVCKKVEDATCPTIDQGYKYIKSANKCYKVNKRTSMWDEAMRTCYMEGGILAVLENKEQNEAILDRLERGMQYHVGVRRMFFQPDYYTIKGQKFDDVYRRYAGYPVDNLNCIAVYNEEVLRTTTTDCGNRLPFICEMEVN